MKLPQHAAASAVISGALHLAFRSGELTLSSFAAGVFIDLDHVLDFFREHGVSADVPKFFHACHGRHFERAVLFLHAWELLPVLGVVAWQMGWNAWALGALIGMGHHLMLDQFSNGVSPFGYSLIWRIRQGFLFEAIFPEPQDGGAERSED